MNNIKTETTQNAIKSLMEKCQTDTEHAKQVCEYCMKLVAATNGKITFFTENEIEYLKTAALLHDIGYCVEKKSHHKHTMAIILEKGIDGFSKYELQIIANTARYHRSSLPDETKHEEYAKLDEKQKKIVNELASILRIADGMDKPHKNLIIRLEMQENETEINFYAKTVGFIPKLKSAQEKSDLFEKTFKKKVKFFA